MLYIYIIFKLSVYIIYGIYMGFDTYIYIQMYGIVADSDDEEFVDIYIYIYMNV
jgi:hypothetical protein